MSSSVHSASSFQPDFLRDDSPRVRRDGHFKTNNKRAVSRNHSVDGSESQGSRLNGSNRDESGYASSDYANSNGYGKQPGESEQFIGRNFDEQQLEEHSHEQFNEPQQQQQHHHHHHHQVEEADGANGQELNEQEFTAQAPAEPGTKGENQATDQEFHEDQFNDQAFAQRKLYREVVRNSHFRQLDESSSDDESEGTMYYRRRGARNARTRPKDDHKTKLNAIIEQEQKAERQSRVFMDSQEGNPDDIVHEEIPEDPDVPASAWHRGRPENGGWNSPPSRATEREASSASARTSRETSVSTTIPAPEATPDLDFGDGWSGAQTSWTDDEPNARGNASEPSNGKAARRGLEKSPRHSQNQHHGSNIPTGPGLIRVQPRQQVDPEPARLSGIRVDKSLNTSITGPAVEALARSAPRSPPRSQPNGAPRAPRGNVSFEDEQQQSSERREDQVQQVPSEQEQTRGTEASSQQTTNANTTREQTAGSSVSPAYGREMHIQVDLDVELEMLKAKIKGDIKLTFL